jgi:hypothetical protein
MTRWSCAWVCLLLVSVAQTSAAQDSLPTDAELRSAYCIPVLRWEINLARQADSQLGPDVSDSPPEQKARTLVREGIAKLESTLNRLQLYLLPRIMHRDPVALAAAQNRGEADVRQVQAVSDRCVKDCGASNPLEPSDDKKRACLDSCKPDMDLVTRVGACASPTWLPF